MCISSHSIEFSLLSQILNKEKLLEYTHLANIFSIFSKYFVKKLQKSLFFKNQNSRYIFLEEIPTLVSHPYIYSSNFSPDSVLFRNLQLTIPTLKFTPTFLHKLFSVITYFLSIQPTNRVVSSSSIFFAIFLYCLIIYESSIF